MAAGSTARDVDETYADLVAAEDVLLFVNAAITSTGQREFHTEAWAQRLSLDFLHAYMLANYRPLYAATLALGVNDHNAALIIKGLLESGAPAASASEAPSASERRLEGRLIARRLAELPPQRVYGLFTELARAGVNNRRARAVVRDWLAARPDPAFDAVKYRGAVKRALRHAHLSPADAELGAFLFAPSTRTRFAAPLLESWRRAHYESCAIYELPFTVAEGFAARRGIDRAAFLERIAPRMTRLETLRVQSSALARDRATLTAAVRVDLGRMPLTRLAAYVLSLPLDERAARRAELTGALRCAARRAAGTHRGSWGRVTAVLDDSFSSYGSGQKRRRPLAVALGCNFLLEALSGAAHDSSGSGDGDGDGTEISTGDKRPAFTALWTSGRTDALLTYPFGASPLGRRILDALESRPGGVHPPDADRSDADGAAAPPDRIVIVSDGWDNAPPGLAAEVLRAWRTRLDPDRLVSIVHLNPVYDAADFEVRRLAPSVPTAGIRDAEDLPALVELAQFAEGRTGLAELKAYLDARAARWLAADPREAAAASGRTP